MGERLEEVARGTWFYDDTVPYIVAIYAAPPELDYWPEDEEGFEPEIVARAEAGECVYRVAFGSAAEGVTSVPHHPWFRSLEEAKTWVAKQIWGPVTWA